MPARDYGDLSRLALEAELDIGEFRERLQRMRRPPVDRVRACGQLYVHAVRESRTPTAPGVRASSFRKPGPSGAGGMGRNHRLRRSRIVELETAPSIQVDASR